MILIIAAKVSEFSVLQGFIKFIIHISFFHTSSRGNSVTGVPQDLDFLVMFPTAGMTVDLVPVAVTVREATAVGFTTPGLVPVTWGKESHLLFLFFSSKMDRNILTSSSDNRSRNNLICFCNLIKCSISSKSRGPVNKKLYVWSHYIHIN